MPKAKLKISDLSQKAKEEILKNMNMTSVHILKTEDDLEHVKNIELIEKRLGDSVIHIAKLNLFPEYVELTDKTVIDALRRLSQRVAPRTTLNG
jgi:hypothetical protein